MAKVHQSESDDVILAALADKVSRYDQMCVHMKSVVINKKCELSAYERQLFAIAYKNASGERRAVWRQLLTEERHTQRLADEAGSSNTDNCDGDTIQQLHHCAKLSREYRMDIEIELRAICNEVLYLIHQHLLPLVNPSLALLVPEMLASASSYRERGFESVEDDLEQQLVDSVYAENILGDTDNCETVVFWYKMMGDYHRFLAEFAVEENGVREAATEHARGSYFVATSIGRTQLAATHPVRLALALNFSVLYYEILQKPDRACRLAENSFDEAIAAIDDASDVHYEESLTIMQLMKDNLKLWT